MMVPLGRFLRHLGLLSSTANTVEQTAQAGTTTNGHIGFPLGDITLWQSR